MFDDLVFLTQHHEVWIYSELYGSTVSYHFDMVSYKYNTAYSTKMAKLE